ncbi:hypothetical protein BDV06DRAFT_225746 [Aspergillus oleicola]
MDAGVGGEASLATLIQLAATTINYTKKVVDAPAHKRQLPVSLIQTRDLLVTLSELTVKARKRAVVSLSKEQEIIVRSLSFGALRDEVDGDKIMGMRVCVEWLLSHEKFKQWRNASLPADTLVLTGRRPGTGKLTIRQAIHFYPKACNQSEIDVCFAYVAFRYPEGEKITESSVLSDIVQQVVLERPFLMKHVSALGVTCGPLSSS